jgi:hypothetical protein
MPWPKGKPKDDATKEKIRLAKLGRAASKQARDNISRAIKRHWSKRRPGGDEGQ